ncbi:MAG: hypothetical protein ACI9FY_000492 [Patiriisocius sp.]|jgi:hypothetical protein
MSDKVFQLWDRPNLGASYLLRQMIKLMGENSRKVMEQRRGPLW